MTNPNENKSYREVQQESYTDNSGNTHTNVTRTSETVNNKVDPKSYENGYVNGQTSERIYQEETFTQRDNENANRGLLIGILLTALAGFLGGSVWYFNQRDQAVDNTVAPVAVPGSVSSPSPTPTPTVTVTPQPQTTIIERTKEVPVEKTKEVPVFIPVPQQKAAPAPTVKPNINITVPPQQPAAKQTAAPITPTPSSSSNSSSSSSSTTTSPTTSLFGNSTATPEEKQNKTDVTPSSSSSPSENDNL
jgi:outer membrane biosynthesis protein TonB